MTALFKLNLFIFLIYFLLQPFDCLEGFLFFRFFRSLIELAAIMAIPGLNMTALAQIIFKKKFNFWEIISVSAIFSLLVMPFILSLEYNKLKIVFDWLPLTNSFLVLLTLLAFCFFSRNAKLYLDNFNFKAIKFNLALIRPVITSPIFWAYPLYFFLTFIIFSAYYALPDLDPYYWFSIYLEQFKNSTITEISLYRPLFSSLAYIFNQSANIDLYAFFKYTVPLLTIMILFPASLVASKFPSKVQQAIILLFVFVNSSTILYLHLPIPQSILTIIVFYFFFFTIYSWISEKKFFYYLAGLIILLAYFYHEIAIAIFLPWLIITLIFDRKKLWNNIKKKWLTVFLVSIIIISNFFLPIKNSFLFLTFWSKKILLMASAMNSNWLFPKYYTNIDGNPMGWDSLDGVVKYYLFYMGPATFLILLAIVIFLIKNKKFREYLQKEISQKKEVAIIVTSFLLFFSISEFSPRAFSIALLPERAWNLGGIFSLIFIIIILKFYNNKHKLLYYILIFTFLINVGGAIYINNLKKFTITKEQLASAEWIKNNLPNNKILLSDTNKNLLRTHAQSETYLVSSEFYYDPEIYNKEITSFKNQDIDINKEYKQYTETLKNILEKLEKKKPNSQQEAIISLNKKAIREVEIIDSFLSPKSTRELDRTSLFIYYSEKNKKNPYLNRPYYGKTQKLENEFIFDRYPDKFRRVFYNREVGIIIWKIL